MSCVSNPMKDSNFGLKSKFCPILGINLHHCFVWCKVIFVKLLENTGGVKTTEQSSCSCCLHYCTSRFIHSEMPAGYVNCFHMKHILVKSVECPANAPNLIFCYVGNVQIKKKLLWLKRWRNPCLKQDSILLVY